MKDIVLKKTVLEVRRGIIDSIYSAKSGTPEDHSQQRIFLHICILKK